MLTHVGTQIINTSRLILRPFDYKDIQSMLENWIADEEIQSLYSEPTYWALFPLRVGANLYLQ